MRTMPGVDVDVDPAAVRRLGPPAFGDRVVVGRREAARFAGDAGEVPRRRGRTADADRSVDHLDVVGINLVAACELVDDALPQRGDRADDRAAPQRRGPAAAGTDEVERRDVGVAVHDPHPGVVDRQPVGGELGQRGLVTLPVRLLAGQDRDRAVGLEAGVGALRGPGRRARPQRGAVVGRPGRRLDEGRDPDTEVPTLPAGHGLLLAEPGEVGDLDGPLEGLARGHEGQCRAGHHLGGQLVGRQEVAQAHLDRVEPERPATTSSRRLRAHVSDSHGPRNATYVALFVATTVVSNE